MNMQAPIHRRPVRLPPPFRDWVDALSAELMQAPGMKVDFTQPAGEAALAPVDSVSWRVFKNPVTVFVGGVAAVLLELAEPHVRDGVWNHSTFRRDALTRLKRTGMAAMVTVYGPRRVAEKMIAGVIRAHEQVAGTTREGDPYRANDPELLLWVQATATFGFVGAYDAYVRELSPAEWDSAVAEAAPSARLYGVTEPPGSRAELDEVFERFEPRLGSNEVIAEFLSIMQEVEAFPAPGRPLQRRLLRAAVEMLPPRLRNRIGLDTAEWRLGRIDRQIVRTAARAADRLVLARMPAAQASVRMGLPEDWLYRER